MTKSERYSFIAAFCRKAGKTHTVAVVAIAALPSEVKEETGLAARHNDDESIIDVDANISIISADMEKATGEARRLEYHHAGEECLTAHERQLAKQDLMAYREERRKWLLVPADFFTRHAIFA